MKKIIRTFSYVLLAGIVALIGGILAFTILIVAGASPKLQTIWICSAMRTMSHQYLATALFSDEYIDTIMKANSIDDTGYDSELLTFPPKTEELPAEPETVPPSDDFPEQTEVSSETILPSEEPIQPEPEKIIEPEPERQTEPEPEPVSEPQPKTKPEEPIFVEGVPHQEPVQADADDTPAAPAEQKTAKEEPKPEEIAPTSTDYESEGYEKLEDGLYLKEVSGLTWRGYVMLIEDPLRVKLTDTSQQYVCGENVMTMTKNAGAVAGMNGGAFQDGANYDSNGGTPAGLIIKEGSLICPKAADNETVYNMIGINADGVLILRHCTAEWALTNRIVSCVSFSPFLVVNGEGLIKEGSGGWGIAPRTAIGQRETGEMLFLVIDGRQVDWSIGCDLDVLQQVMLEEKAVNAAMLDGGSSTAMVYKGEYINRPSLGHERWINNCFVVMPKT